ncbi:MAG: sensor histidine kinase [Sphingomonas sp.]
MTGRGTALLGHLAPRRNGLRGIVVLFGLALALVLMLLGSLAFVVTEARLNAQVDHSLRKREWKLLKPTPDGSRPTVATIRARISYRETDRTISQLGHRLLDPRGHQIAGTVVDLLGSGAVPGPVLFREVRGHHLRKGRALTTYLPDGSRLDIVAESELVENMGKILWPMFLAMAVVATIAGMAASLALRRVIAKRLSTTRQTADAIVAGNLASRVPVDPLDGMFADQARSFNRMLDRIEALMAQMRQVSTDVAHDLRTPITRLRGTLEAARNPEPAIDRDALIERALGECDGILNVFAALLRLAEIEAGQRRASVRVLALDALVDDVAESMAPVLEDAGLALRLGALDETTVCACPELLNQLLVNLLENAARHAGSGATVTLGVTRMAVGRTARLRVADSGSGIAASDRERVMRRFVRLDHSRSLPGNGLGLALVDAIARLHGGTIELNDNRPGLIVDVLLPLAAVDERVPATGLRLAHAGGASA